MGKRKKNPKYCHPYKPKCPKCGNMNIGRVCGGWLFCRKDGCHFRGKNRDFLWVKNG